MHPKSHPTVREFWYTFPKNWNFKDPRIVYPRRLWFIEDHNTKKFMAVSSELTKPLGVDFDQYNQNLFDTEQACREVCRTINDSLKSFYGDN